MERVLSLQQLGLTQSTDTPDMISVDGNSQASVVCDEPSQLSLLLCQ